MPTLPTLFFRKEERRLIMIRINFTTGQKKWHKKCREKLPTQMPTLFY